MHHSSRQDTEAPWALAVGGTVLLKRPEAGGERAGEGPQAAVPSHSPPNGNGVWTPEAFSCENPLLSEAA